MGETTSVVKSRIGYHIVKLTGKKLTTDPRFERAKEGIKAQLLEKSFNRQLKLWLQNKKDEAFIRIND
ncbi:peptidylprolyl isomerase [compost metagenome]